MEGKDSLYIVNGTMLCFALVYFIFLMTIGSTLFYMGRIVSAIVFILIAIPFLYLIYQYGSVVSISRSGISLRFLWIKRREISWEDVAELDVIGSKVLTRNKKKCGTLYFIFSEEELDDAHRFDMMLNWPPKDKIYFKFTKERLLNIQWFYNRPVNKYNVGMLDI